MASAVVRVRDEFYAYTGGSGELPVEIKGKAYVPKPGSTSEVAGV